MDERKYTIWRFSPMQLFKLFFKIVVLLVLILPIVFPELGVKVWNFFFVNFKSFISSLNFIE